ncbi:M10 family metallopeptidase domain-containing protein [Microbulbifer sp. CAU 1566]|uniref:matrixin family metalloprotease n=1 Tax=Microbulbifer sp. CAU 1566 TaxID=2933269 RepID=UPI0020068094|nr:matrixin family metalloprotease [Microbulbifer sp. CAU 1566]MCK7596212.1 M10 family metallopeptidase domain-containing protein [Microbulbifer sp. CAU 1566]
MKISKLTMAIGLAVAANAVHAGGPLYTTDGDNPQPLKWDTSKGTIPVYTDGGEAFTFDYDGETPFLTIQRANEITAHAFANWSDVPTSTFSAEISGTIEEMTGIADVTGENAAEIYNKENGYGFWVLYDTDGSILEEYFGVPKESVLGIAFPEWADEDNNIIEATAVMNGWNVWEHDTEGNQVAGVFTHEFGHAINLSHSQVNGSMAYMSYTYAPNYPGIEGCGVEAVHRYDYPSAYGANNANPAIIETMFPFIDHSGQAGVEQSTVDHPDDRAAISNIYPTADYASTTGTITGVLRLKDGVTEYSGINVIARNVNNPMFDAVSDMTGSATQGKIGPDGRFTIRNLTPGESYVLYLEEIVAGGYPTTPQRLASVGEYWNLAESSDPLSDDACEATLIVAEAGVTKEADFYFNGFEDGVQVTPVVAAFIRDMSKSGKVAAGEVGSTAFMWYPDRGFMVLPPEYVPANGAMSRNGQKMLVHKDINGNGIQEPVIWSAKGDIALGDLNGNSCGGGGSTGVTAASGWDMDDAGKTAIGLAYKDTDGDGVCQGSFKGEIVPWVWTEKDGMQELDTSALDKSKTQFVRAHAISGNGNVVLGSNSHSKAVAWVNGGSLLDLGTAYGAYETYAASYDGTKVALSTRNGVQVWNPQKGLGSDAVTNVGSLRWCHDMPYNYLGRDFCALLGEDAITQAVGSVPLTVFDMSDDGTVMVGRAGSFFLGLAGGLWVEGIGWMHFADFLKKQGVVEMDKLPLDNPISISASGKEIAGGLAGASFSWHIDLSQVHVCNGGVTQQTGFPGGLRDAVAAGAQVGRCEFLD